MSNKEEINNDILEGLLKEKLEKMVVRDHDLDEDDIQTIKRLIRFFDEYEPQLKEVVVQQKTSELWAKVRLKAWIAIKWVLTTFLLLIAAYEAYMSTFTSFLARIFS